MGLLEKRKVQLAALLSCFAANFVPLFFLCAHDNPLLRCDTTSSALFDSTSTCGEASVCLPLFPFFFFFFFPFLSFLTHTLLYFPPIVTSTMLCSSNDQPTLRGSFQKSKCADNRPCVVYIPLLLFQNATHRITIFTFL